MSMVWDSSRRLWHAILKRHVSCTHELGIVVFRCWLVGIPARRDMRRAARYVLHPIRGVVWIIWVHACPLYAGVLEQKRRSSESLRRAAGVSTTSMMAWLPRGCGCQCYRLRVICDLPLAPRNLILPSDNLVLGLGSGGVCVFSRWT